jgi:hypothetical protein
MVAFRISPGSAEDQFTSIFFGLLKYGYSAVLVRHWVDVAISATVLVLRRKLGQTIRNIKYTPLYDGRAEMPGGHTSPLTITVIRYRQPVGMPHFQRDASGTALRS